MSRSDNDNNQFSGLSQAVPLLHWLKNYNRDTFLRDLLGASIVSFMFLPQSLAYAILAGLPVQMGLYASVVPLIGYALFGTSRVLAVGPVAIISLMTASALAPLATAGTPLYVSLAMALALASGVILILMGIFRLGFLSNLLSYTVISSFVTASAVIIALSQLSSILGIKTSGSNLVQLVPQFIEKLPDFNQATLALGAASLAFLIAARLWLGKLLLQRGFSPKTATMIGRAGPLGAAVVFTLISMLLDLPSLGVKTVGQLPSGFVHLGVPEAAKELTYANWRSLLFPAILISIIGFVESVSVAQVFAAKRRELIHTNSELIGLGASNALSFFAGAMPVSGGFSRSVVNSDAGVETQVASLFTAAGIGLIMLFLTPVIAHVPQAVLAATIMVAVLSLAELKILWQTWTYSKADFTAAAATMLITLVEGVELGVAVGVSISVLMYLNRTATPHIAIVGLVPKTEHFRNINRHNVLTSNDILSLRIDESLYFVNAKYLEESVTELLLEYPKVKHFVLICSAINFIDSSALESLESINHRLRDMGVQFHLSEVKGPVMDRLKRSDFLSQITGKVFLSQFLAISELDPALVKRAFADGNDDPDLEAA